MPWKSKTPAVKIRLRDNQRKSRARRQEFVEDLQRRLQEYEQRGVQATHDMQRAARAVALENDRLRDLLAYHGVSKDAVNRFLHLGLLTPDCQPVHGDGNPSDTSSQNTQPHHPNGVSPSAVDGRLSSPSPQRTRTLMTPQLAFQASSDVNFSVNASSITVHSNVGSVLGTAQEGPNENSDNNEASSLDLHTENAAQEHTPLAPTAACRVASPADKPVASSMETLCDAAAAIIADVHGHYDKDRVLTALGCPRTSGCVVKNTKIFDLIDNSAELGFRHS